VSPGINLDKALALANAIEDQELASKMQLRTPSIPIRRSRAGATLAGRGAFRRGTGWSAERRDVAIRGEIAGSARVGDGRRLPGRVRAPADGSTRALAELTPDQLVPAGAWRRAKPDMI
jgi:hypothetical protein